MSEVMAGMTSVRYDWIQEIPLYLVKSGVGDPKSLVYRIDPRDLDRRPLDPLLEWPALSLLLKDYFSEAQEHIREVLQQKDIMIKTEVSAPCPDAGSSLATLRVMVANLNPYQNVTYLDETMEAHELLSMELDHLLAVAEFCLPGREGRLIG
jgi:hypothetical protein